MIKNNRVLILSLIAILLLLSSTFSYASSEYSFKEVDKSGVVIGESNIDGIELELEFDDSNDFYPIKLDIGLFSKNSLIKTVAISEISTKTKINFGETSNYSPGEIYEIKYKADYLNLGNHEKTIEGDWETTGKYFSLMEIEDTNTDLEEATLAVEVAESTVKQTDVDSARILVNKLEEGIDKDSLNARLDAVQALIDKEAEDKEEEDKLQEATLAVEKAESTIKQTDVDSARVLVDGLKASGDKTDLSARLDAVQEIINIREALLQEAIEAVEKAEETITQEDLDSARALVNALPNGTDKTNLNKRLDAVQAKIDAEKEEDTKLQEAIAAVELAETTIEQADVDTARALVNSLKVGEAKTELNNRLDDVQALIDADKLLREATEAVERAEANQNQSSVNSARTRVDRLPEASDKVELHARLDIVQRNIDALKAIGDGEIPDGGIEDYPSDIIEEINNLQEAIEAVEKAEQTVLQEDVDSARALVNKLNPGKGKNDLNARLNEVQKKIDNAKLLEEATLAVEKAEDTREKLDIRDAYSKVNRLPNGQEKTALLNRLKALENELIEEEKVQKEESDAIRAVEIAEIFKGREPHLSRAQEKVDALEEGTLKDLLQERLDRLTGKNSSGNEFDDPKYIDSVERMVKQAEAFKREPHIGNARSAVDKLSEGEVKDDFNRRLNALEGKSGLGSGLTFEQQVKSVERFVSQAEVYRTESRVEIARDKVNEMEDSIEKADFLDRLDEIAVR